MIPPTVTALSLLPACSYQGHTNPLLLVCSCLAETEKAGTRHKGAPFLQENTSGEPVTLHRVLGYPEGCPATAAQCIKPEAPPGVRINNTAAEKGTAPSKQEGTLFSQQTDMPPAYNYLYRHEKAEESGPVKNHPDNPRERAWENRYNQSS